MDIINKTKLQFAFINGRMGYPQHSLTLIVKGTFDLANGKETLYAEEQEYPSGDELYVDDDEGTGSVMYESDFAYFKPKADLLLTGKCYPQSEKPVPESSVTFQVGNISKTLNVFGNRYWQGLMNISNPEPFTEMDLRYENSFGGEGYKNNPVGKGFGKTLTESGKKIHLLPNVENFQQLIRLPGDRPVPIGFGPLNKMWDQRFTKMGKYKGNWLKERWPWFPKDFDWSHFNASPTDMQVEGYLKGDEKLYFENLHPTHSKYNSQLPGQRIRIFINEIKKDNPTETIFREVELNLDTLWVNLESEKLVLVWRGFTEIVSEDFEEIQHTFIVSENLNEPTEPLEFYKTLFYQAIIEKEEDEVFEEEEPIEPEDTAEIDNETAKAEEQIRNSLIEAGIDPDTPPEPSAEEKIKEAEIFRELGIVDEADEIHITRDVIEQRINNGESFADEDLSGIDLSNLKIIGIDFNNAIMAECSFENSDLSGVDMTSTNLEKANFNNAKMENIKLNDADLSNAILTNVNLTRAELIDSIFENANLENAILDKVEAADGNFTSANLTNASLKWGQFQGGYFTRAIINNVNFSGANLQDVSMEGATGVNVDMTAADLTQLRATDGCNFTKGIFRESIGRESIWENANLEESDFSYSQMEGADFTSANLERSIFFAADMKFSRFSKANLQEAKFVYINLFQASLEKTNLCETDFSNSNLYEVEFLDSKVVNTKFTNTNLKMTKLSK